MHVVELFAQVGAYYQTGLRDLVCSYEYIEVRSIGHKTKVSYNHQKTVWCNNIFHHQRRKTQHCKLVLSHNLIHLW